MPGPFSTLREVLRDNAKKNPRSLALWFKDDRFTYAEFQGHVHRAANALLRLGIAKGEKIGLLLPNCPEFLFSVFATAETGAVFVPVNTASTAEEAQYVLQHSEAATLVTAPDHLALVDSIRDRLPRLERVIVAGEVDRLGSMSWERFLHGAGDEAPGIPVSPDELASITYTSGTTDRPKGVMLSQYAYAFAPRKRAEALGWTGKDRVFVLLPLFHVNALCHMAIGMLSVGGSVVLAERFSASRFWDEVRAHEVTTSSLMRTIPQILLSLPEKPDDGDNPLRLAVALLAPEVHLRFEERFNLTAVPSYSLTEDILSVIGPLEKSRRKLGSCGVPIAPEEHGLRIADEDGEPLPPGRLGEIVKRSPAVMQGYFKNPQATAQALKEGWLYTGDLGYVDDDGFLFFVDRKKDMVRRGDENISSEEVERVLNSHPLIAESAVVGVADEIRGEEIKAYVVLKPPATAETVPPERIWAFCGEHLAPFKVPRFLEYWSELPKTPSSKIQKNLLREPAGKFTGAAPVFDRLARPGRS
jgi:acyl-CoA synthetase (AMP-forming)/AMP-acid ligase II